MISQPHGGMPGLQQRPNGSLRNNQPLATGSVSEQLNSVASGIAEYMRHGIEEILRELSSQGSPEATVKGLQLELEKMQWRHQQEMAEVKHNADLVVMEGVQSAGGPPNPLADSEQLAHDAAARPTAHVPPEQLAFVHISKAGGSRVMAALAPPGVAAEAGCSGGTAAAAREELRGWTLDAALDAADARARGEPRPHPFFVDSSCSLSPKKGKNRPPWPGWQILSRAAKRSMPW